MPVCAKCGYPIDDGNMVLVKGRAQHAVCPGQTSSAEGPDSPLTLGDTWILFVFAAIPASLYVGWGLSARVLGWPVLGSLGGALAFAAISAGLSVVFSARFEKDGESSNLQMWRSTLIWCVVITAGYAIVALTAASDDAIGPAETEIAAHIDDKKVGDSEETAAQYERFDCSKGKFPRARLLSCRGGTLVYDIASHSPLRRNTGSVGLESDVSRTVNKVVQEIPTKTQGKEFLDIGFWFNNWFAELYQSLPPIKIIHVPLRMIEGLLELIMMTFSSAYDNAHIVTVDNAMNIAVDVYIGNLRRVRLAAHSHKTLVFRGGVRVVTVKNVSNGELIEQFRAKFPTEDAMHIYSVNSANTYKII